MELKIKDLKKTIVDVISYSSKQCGVNNPYFEKLCFNASKIEILENENSFLVKIPLPNSNSGWTNEALELYFVLEHLYNGFIDWSYNLSNNKRILCIAISKFIIKKQHSVFEFILQLQEKRNYLSNNYLNNNKSK